jgi:hypothetical protein
MPGCDQSSPIAGSRWPSTSERVIVPGDEQHTSRHRGQTLSSGG